MSPNSRTKTNSLISLLQLNVVCDPMKYLALVALVFSLLVFGCGGNQPPEVKVNTTVSIDNTSTSGGGNIVIVGTKNTSSDVTKPPEEQPPEEKPKEKSTGAKYESTPDERFAVYFIDVGDASSQGDAILVKRGDLDVLIDAGPVQNAGKVIDFLNGRGVDDIDVLISTEPDPEHYGGINLVLDNFKVEEFWWTGNSYDDPDYQNIISRTGDSGALMRVVRRGEAFTLNGLDFNILNPKEGSSFSDLHNNAIVTKITNNDFCMLLTSDITSSAASEITNTQNVACNLMQLPYHGLSKGNSQIDLFLLKVKPIEVFVSGGSYDPSPDGRGTRPPIFAKLEIRSIPHHENYEDGTIKVESDGTNYAVDFIKE